MSSLPYIIGLTGQKMVGKDTVADYLCNLYNYQKKSFAEPLKQACQIIFGLTEQQLYHQEHKETLDMFWNYTPRQLMQILGTDLLRNNFDQNIWTKLMEKYIQNNLNNYLVIPDIRFQNEADLIKKYNGIIIKITRTNIENSDQHSSEQQTVDYDYLIKNDEDLIYLYQHINKILL